MSSKRKPPFSGDPLPRGRHGLSSQFVRASQRERVVRAMLTLVAEQGYIATTVPAVVAAARVSRNAFYEFFQDKQECFLVAAEEAAADVFATMETFGLEQDWIQGIRRGLSAWLGWWEARPGLARAWLIELPLAGGEAAEQHQRAAQPYVQLFRRIAERIRREHPGLPPMPEFVPTFLVAGLLARVTDEVRTNGAANLTRLVEPGVYITVKLLADDRTARTLLPP
ncbi:TetR family transcriptional regulator [Solimonas sp. K1W22B-7]|uniref:TetR/AcrR family transcriptional regulator n=1 Tax=Solimonas sp. K1W22B-7 TaxID=2303331 RepID=UPI000E32E8D1|nr:TetR family transcriptional regulator [Solimonas sp. K1W22B-7]AXQ27458.1 TetR family transcriptional regulator [Solimonas sp. K1W22B-7]